VPDLHTRSSVVVVKVVVFAEAVGVVGGRSLYRWSVSDRSLYRGERGVEGRRGEERDEKRDGGGGGGAFPV
jgi:hypothetical protein